MAGELPFVSVLMTAYNREQFISEAIESVLASTYTNFELIIVDDCSNDETIKIANIYTVKDSRVKLYINQNNLGDYPNRNKAASYARGIYITYVDSDDAIFPHTLQTMINAVEQFPNAALFIPVRPNDESIDCFQYLVPRDTFYLHFKVNGFLETGPLGILINKRIFNEFNGFSGKRMIGDTELWFKIAFQYPIVRTTKKLIFWREHPGQEYSEGRKYYLIDSLIMYKNILLNNQFPLGIIEGKKLYLKIRRTKYIYLLKYILKTFRISESYSYFIMLQNIR